MSKQTKETNEEYLVRQNKKLSIEFRDLMLAKNRLERDVTSMTHKAKTSESELREGLVNEISRHKKTKQSYSLALILCLAFFILIVTVFIGNDLFLRETIDKKETKIRSITYASQIIEAYMAGDKDSRDSITVVLTSDRGQDFNALITRK